MAFSKQATGTLTTDSHGYPNFAGTPSPSLLNWFPIVDAGTFTGQGQGPWTLTGNADYVAMAGEFTIINNQPQQGLTRFAKSSIAPDLRGPRITGLNFNPTLSTPAAGAVRVRWQANWDQDNENLTYEVRRNGAVISTVNQASTFWRRPGMTFTDTGLVPGRSYGYRIFARDAFGNEARSDTVSVTAAGSVAAPGDYAQQVLADQPGNYWRLGEIGGGHRRGPGGQGRPDRAAGGQLRRRRSPGRGRGHRRGLQRDRRRRGRQPDARGQAQHVQRRGLGPDHLNQGRRDHQLREHPDRSLPDSDRKVYLDSSGRIFFGVRPTGTSSGGARITVNTTATYNDDQWHHIVATLGPDGMQLFVDGVLGAKRTGTTTAWPFDGYWRIGGDTLEGWPGWPAVSPPPAPTWPA